MVLLQKLRVGVRPNVKKKPSNGHVTVARTDFHGKALAVQIVRCDDGSSRACERLVNDVPRLRPGLDDKFRELDREDRGVMLRVNATGEITVDADDGIVNLERLANEFR